MIREYRSLAIQRLARSYILFLFLAQVAIGVVSVRAGRQFSFDDWLINYQGGFVRRGFIGNIFFLLGRVLHIDPVYFVVVTGICCYALIFYSVWRLLSVSSWRWWVLCLVLSPAALAFPVLAPDSGYRKEILYLAGLAYLIERLNRPGAKAPGNAFLMAYLSCVSLLLILSHEGLVAYLPYYAAVLLICFKKPAQVIAISILPIILSGLAMAATLSHIGNAETVEEICSSIGTPDLSHCSDSIKYLAVTKAQARALVAKDMRDYHYLRNYSVLLILAAIPYAGGFWTLSRRRANRPSAMIVLGAALIASFLSLGLFEFGTDWGRWIYIHLFSLLLLLLMIDARRVREEETLVLPFRRPWALKVASAILVFVYATCWSIPGTADSPLFGYLGMTVRVMGKHGMVPAFVKARRAHLS